MAMTVMAKKEILKLVASAMKPMMGGPIRKPKNPNDDTAVSAMPGESVFDFPAALYTMGTTDDTPAPIKKNPINEGIIEGNATAINRPIVVKRPLP